MMQLWLVPGAEVTIREQLVTQIGSEQEFVETRI